MTERIPCPVDGCDEDFDDEAAAAAHMKEKHRDHFSDPVFDTSKLRNPGDGQDPEDDVVLPTEEVTSVPGLEMVPPGLLEIMDKRMDDRITASIPKIVNALKQAIASGAPGAALPPGGGVIPGSPVTPAGAELIRWMTRGGGGGSTDMESLAKTLTQARAISDVLNPPSIWDRVMQNAVLRSLSKAGLVTEAEMKEIIDETKKPS